MRSGNLGGTEFVTLPTGKLTTNFGISNPVADYFRRDIRDCSQSAEGNDHLQCVATQRMLPNFYNRHACNKHGNFQKHSISKYM